MVLGEPDWYMQKNETRPPTYTITRINSKWMKDLNRSEDTMKVLAEGIGSKLSDISHSSMFADTSPRTRGV